MNNPVWRRAPKLNKKPKPSGKAGKKPSKKGGDRQSNNSGNPPPSPWLNPDNEPEPNPTASFVEYLRWMREPERDKYKDGTKVQILQMATEGANYRDRLSTLTKRTELIAGKGNTFQVICPWRIRVGGHRGPESILLPAFDSLGMPYIPSSTLRGVARTQALREALAKNPQWDWKDAELAIAPYFGHLEPEGKNDHMGKVTFLDAYPVPSNAGGLTMDMANNIWGWEKNQPTYGPNPNPFLSLQEPGFLIGLCPSSTCPVQEIEEILKKVKQWLIDGLKSGIGAQVNTGYGQLLRLGDRADLQTFLRINWSLEGQLIHGHQRFTQWNWNERRKEWQMRGQPQAEVRPTAFKSMLRYWFRAFALGVLEGEQVQTLEARLFGGIQPLFEAYGYVRVNMLDGKVTQKEPRPTRDGQRDKCGEQEGTLTLALSTETPKSSAKDVEQLCTTLTWLMFNLGGIGQGARRPCYSRKNRERAPWWRGSTFQYFEGEGQHDFSELPEDPSAFVPVFQRCLRGFYRHLAALSGETCQLRGLPDVTAGDWQEAIDQNCYIFAVSGESDNGKPYALAQLHSEGLKVNGEYVGDLCGQVQKGVKPSPIWVADMGDFQIVTVFGAKKLTERNIRLRYLQVLKNNADEFKKLFPLPVPKD
ncbi:MAG: type III-B CRISPR module RAMP protein Cmr6 [Spirulina sp. SIO3F2]|nr:type III-B CRISPR module RAMP protein Cmr6 [Spirulina sp. SIO3F2]